MPVRIAKNSGFCFGVKCAVETVERELAHSKNGIYTLGDIIHNPIVVDDLAKRGATPVNSVEEVAIGSTLVIRAHGAPSQVYEYAVKNDIRIVDATCPFVKRVQGIANEYSLKGYDVIVIGQSDHPEVIGICGWSNGRSHVLSSTDDCTLLAGCDRACVVAQTTVQQECFDAIVKRLREIIPTLIEFNTICHTTIARQKEAEELSKTSDVVIIIGGKKSSNTRKLYTICQKHCDKSYMLENEDESILEKIRADDIISIIAGASTPNWMIMEVAARMIELENNVAEIPENKPEVVDKAVEAVATDEAKAAEAASDASAETDFMEAFEKTLVRIRNGQVITGTIVQITDNEVCVNIGYKSDGFIPSSEFSSDPDVKPSDIVKVGDEIEVEIIKVNDGEGNVVLSHKNVQARRAWDAFIEGAEEPGRVFEAEAKEVVKGGVIAYIDGVRTFIPASQVSTKYVENLAEYVGQPMRLKILEIDKSKHRVVASQKAVLIEETEGMKRKAWEALEPGMKVKGIVRRLTDFGAFIDIGGVDGLVHVTELAWGRVKHPSDILKINDEIEVIIKSLDPEKERISLGYKELLPKPWATASERYPEGSIVEGKVVRIVPFGAFVSLEPTIDGLVHISQVDTKRIAKVEDVLKIGDIIRCKVLSVDHDAKRISLSRREAIQEEMPQIEDIMSSDEELESHVDAAKDVAAKTEDTVSEVVEKASEVLDDFPKLED